MRLKYWLLGIMAIVLLFPIVLNHGFLPDAAELTRSIEEVGAYGGVISGGIQILIWAVLVFMWLNNGAKKSI
jgi:phosphoserine phosphatase